MSRENTSQWIASPNIFVTQIILSDGKKTDVISSKPLCRDSLQLNTKKNRLLFLTAMGLNCMYRIAQSPNFFLELSVIHQLTHYRGTYPDIWSVIFNFLPFDQHVCDYGVSLIRPTFFRQIINTSMVFDAVMRAEEDIVLNFLHANPALLLMRAEITNAVGVKSIRTPLQAAIICNDIQLVEKMWEHFERLPDGLLDMYYQLKEIYKESLRGFYELQDREVRRLQVLIRTPDNDHALKLAKKNRNKLLLALRSDLVEIVNINREAFDFCVGISVDVDDWINCIKELVLIPESQLDIVMELINAAPEETAAIAARTGVSSKQTDEARGKAFDALTLIEKMNRFREKFIELKKQFVMPDSYPLNTLVTIFDDFYDLFFRNINLMHLEPKRLAILFSQIFGWIQVNASEAVKQDIRQGTWYLNKKNIPRNRPTNFNCFANNDFPDVSVLNLQDIDGWGYKFAVQADGKAYALPTAVQGIETKDQFLLELFNARENKLAELIARLTKIVEPRSRQCVVQ